MFNPLPWYSRLLAGGMMLAVLAAHMPASTASPASASPTSTSSVSAAASAERQSKAQNKDQNAAQNKARRVRRRRRPNRSSRPNRSIRRALPGSPRRLPPNLVQPGGGLDAAAQSCDPDGQPLTALVPVQNPVFTASAHPTFLFYLPDSPEQIKYAEFILLSADEKEEIYTAQFVPMKTGVVSVSLPPTAAPALEANQAYHWYLNLHCKTAVGKGASSPAVNGWVQRLPESETVMDEIAANMPVDATADVEMPEVWYDAIAQVAETLAEEPTALSQNSEQTSEQTTEQAIDQTPGQIPESTGLNRTLWENWLSAVGLSEVADAPVVGEVTPE